jgi:toxin-antitoxin system PIN domain toxin
MILADVNGLIYAPRAESPEHADHAAWLTAAATSDEPFGISELVLSAVVRIVTNQRMFRTPTPLETARRSTDELRERPNAVRLQPGDRHWEIFRRFPGLRWRHPLRPHGQK